MASVGMRTEFLINKYNWSSYTGFLIFLGLVILVALPTTRKISEISTAWLNLKSLFTITYIIFYGILAMNSGQLQLLLRWGDKSRLGDYLKALLIQLIFLIFITLPYWIIFASITYMSLGSTLWAIAHLLFWGFDLGLVGLVIGLAFKSEVTQFNLKYLGFAAYLIGTLFYARFANPFLALSLIQGEASFFNFFFLKSYATLAIIGLILVFFIRRLIQKERIEVEER